MGRTLLPSGNVRAWLGIYRTNDLTWLKDNGENMGWTNWRSGEGNDRRGLTAGAGMVWQLAGQANGMICQTMMVDFIMSSVKYQAPLVVELLHRLKKKTSLKVDLAFLKTSEKCKSTALWLYKLNLISLLDASIASFWIVVYPI